MKRATSLLEWRSDDDEVRDREVFLKMVLVSPAHPSVLTRHAPLEEPPNGIPARV